MKLSSVLDPKSEMMSRARSTFVAERYLDLPAVLAALARDAGLVAHARDDLVLTPEERDMGKDPSRWVVLARTRSDLGGLAADPRWRQLRADAQRRAWTDDFSDPWSIIRAD